MLRVELFIANTTHSLEYWVKQHGLGDLADRLSGQNNPFVVLTCDQLRQWKQPDNTRIELLVCIDERNTLPAPKPSWSTDHHRGREMHFKLRALCFYKRITARADTHPMPEQWGLLLSGGGLFPDLFVTPATVDALQAEVDEHQKELDEAA